MKNKVLGEWLAILSLQKESPYVFRTRLERAIIHSIKYAVSVDDKVLENACVSLRKKLNYISDQSNQTSDGTLNSYLILQNDFNSIIKYMS